MPESKNIPEKCNLFISSYILALNTTKQTGMTTETELILTGMTITLTFFALVTLVIIWIIQKLKRVFKKQTVSRPLSSPAPVPAVQKEVSSLIDTSAIYPDAKVQSVMNIEAKGKYVSEKESRNLRPVRSLSLQYHYKRKNLIMTPAETRFFKILDEAIGDGYYVFPQVHLSSILEHRIHGQNWWAAFHHINRKSVDFVICDKESVKPLAAIELDDWSHHLDHRKDRDIEVERIFEGAQLPLIRFNGDTRFTYSFVREAISQSGALPLLAP